MIGSLTSTLKALLADASAPASVRAAEVAFERPDDAFSAAKPTLNLFLYDVRESIELRSNEPIVTRGHGMVTIAEPPLRVACSYQVTAWIDSSVTGEQAALAEHDLLGDALRFLAHTPVIDDALLDPALKTATYPVALIAAHPDLIRNPAEFWMAMGGKLRPSFTVTAIVSMDSVAAPIEEHAVASRTLVMAASSAEWQQPKLPPGMATESVLAIGGIVRDAVSHGAIADVEVSLVERGQRTASDADGAFRFTGLAAGTYTLRIQKPGYATKTQAIEVPGASTTAFDVELST